MIDLKRDFNINNVMFKTFVYMTEEESVIVLKWRNDFRVRIWMNDDKIISIIDHEKFIDKLKKNRKTFYWLISENGINMGVVSIKNVDWKKKVAWIGLYVNPDIQGRGFGLKIVSRVEELMFGKFDFLKLKLETLVNNQKARALYLKCGFAETGVKKNRVKRNNENIDAVIMEKVNENQNI